MKEDIFKKEESPKVEVKAKVETKVEDPQEKILEKAIVETKKVAVSKDFTVICTRLKVRKDPSDNADILTLLSSGDKITVDTASTRGAFSKVTAPVDGWVMSKFIAPVK